MLLWMLFSKVKSYLEPKLYKIVLKAKLAKVAALLGGNIFRSLLRTLAVMGI